MNRSSVVGTHWGNYRVEAEGSTLVGVHPDKTDINPSPIGQSILDIRNHRCRIAQPMVRAGYLRGGADKSGQGRGRDPFVPVSWDEALSLAADALRRTREIHGNGAIFGGSYGWSSAGRFHHAQSQVHRFLNMFGGYVASANTYSAAAAEVIIPHVMGSNLFIICDNLIAYDDVPGHTDLMLAFGGMCLTNHQVVPGGVANHVDRLSANAMRDAGVKLIYVGPLADDNPADLKAQWIRSRPNSDVAIMLGLAHELEANGHTDRAFIDRYTVGFDRFRAYLLGESDGVPKTIEWAAALAGIAVSELRDLAHALAAAKRPLITVSLSLQRAEHGEQSHWMAITLAAMLGHIGLPGGGVGIAWGSNGRGYFNRRSTPFSWGKLDQGTNPIHDFIPVARIADMLLSPGGQYDYDGQDRYYPDIRLVYWAGGNPYHHHQDLNRLRRAWAHPDTIIVHEAVWTATAKHADIVLPATTFVERNDVVCGQDAHIMPSRALLAPYGEARSDYKIFSDLARRLDFADQFTETRDEMGWLEHIYEAGRSNAERAGFALPPFDQFWDGPAIELRDEVTPRSFLIERFRADPEANPLETPSGKIEIYSEVIASFRYADCPGHAAWLDKREWLGSALAERFPLHLISHQPKNKLHSQLDFGRNSTKDKVAGREVMRMHPSDAQARGLKDDDIVRVFNMRGACLAAVRTTDDIMERVVSLPTGAWFDPDDSRPDALERHGNPNVLTPDRGTSRLAQGPTAHSCLVEVERHDGPLPEIMAFHPPAIIGLGTPPTTARKSKEA